MQSNRASAAGDVAGAFTFDQTVTTLFFVTLTAAACLMPAQNDTWWHLRAGEEMWLRRFVMQGDEFSFTATGAPWPNHEWLSEVVFFALYRIGGLPVLTFTAAACLAAAIGMSWRLVVGSALTRLVLMAVGIPSLVFVWATRPHVFTQLLLMVVVHLSIRRMFWILPPIFALWANLHGGVALGFVVLGAVMLTDAYLVGIRQSVRLLPIVAVCFAATMVAPLGFDLWPTIPESIHKSVANGIVEWKPPVLGLRDLAFWIVAAALLVQLIRKWRSIVAFDDAFLATLALLLLPLALRHGRNMAPFALVALPAISRTIDVRGFLGRAREGNHQRLNVALVATALVAAIVGVGTAWTAPAPRLQWKPISSTVVNGIQRCPGRLYNRYDDGGYVIWFVRVPVFVDSRQDPYPLEFLQEHLHHERTGDYLPIFAKYKLGCAFLPSGSPTARRMLDDGWKVAAADQSWLVLYPANASSSIAALR